MRRKQVGISEPGVHDQLMAWHPLGAPERSPVGCFLQRPSVAEFLQQGPSGHLDKQSKAHKMPELLISRLVHRPVTTASGLHHQCTADTECCT